MNQTILSRGKSVYAAIELGLDLLGTKKEEVSIEVIQQETKGFLSLGAKEAVVKLTKRDERKELKKLQLQDISELDSLLLESMMEQVVSNQEKVVESNLENAESSIEIENEGKVWVKGGKIFGQPSKLHYPTITAGSGIQILKNHHHVNGTVLLTKEDHFSIVTNEETKQSKWDISIDSNRLNVTLRVEPGFRNSYKVKDVEPSFHITIDAEQETEILNELEFKTVLEALENLGVVHGFNHNAIMEAVNTRTPGEFIIASGIKPKNGQDGRIELVTEAEIANKKGPFERADGTIDFREGHAVPVVEKGQVVAIIHPPELGTIGYTVTNEPLAPKPSYPLIIKTGKGIALIEENTKVVATESGRPLIEQRGLMVKASIIQKLVHPSDVNLGSGNIRFKGDVAIFGNVEEAMVVEADGEVAINKNVFGATVTSLQSVFINGNVIGSTISAGKQNIFSSEMVHLLMVIQEHFHKMILSIEQLLQLPAFKTTDYDKKGLLPLIKLLIEQKFKNLMPPVRKFIELSEKGSHILDLEWLSLSEQLKYCFMTSLTNEYHTISKLKSLLDKILETIDKYNEQSGQSSVISIMYSLNSTLYSAGDVIIKGQGCFNSKIHSGGRLAIHGVFRGGELYARESVKIKEAGSEGGAVSKIIVPAHGTIKIGLAKEGTIIQIGKAKYVFSKQQRNINAKLDSDDQLTF